MNEPVAVVRCDEYEKESVKAALLTAIERVNGFDFLRPGMRVGIKANLVAPAKPESAVATHPTVLAALTELLMERGASVVVGDSGGRPWTASYMNHIYAVCGLESVAKVGAALNQDFSEKEANFLSAVQAKSFRYTGWLDSCDAIINFSKLKSHGMMGLSNAVKNLFGTIPGILKPEYHYRYPNPNDFADMILDIGDYFKPVLHLCDGIVAMEGNGPTQGSPRPLHALLASKNPHLLDWVSARMIGLDIEDVPTLQAARRRAYLPESFEQVTILGDWESLRLTDFQVLKNHNSTLFSDTATAWGRIKRSVLTAALGSRPQVDPRSCIGCAKCAEVCPAKAITMRKKLPVIDRKTCIKCFCCQEFCPKGAMRVHRAVIARLINR